MDPVSCERCRGTGRLRWWRPDAEDLGPMRRHCPLCGGWSRLITAEEVSVTPERVRCETCFGMPWTLFGWDWAGNPEWCPDCHGEGTLPAPEPSVVVSEDDGEADPPCRGALP